MEHGIDLDKLDALKFARAIERDCQEGIRWERRKLEWILAEEERKRASNDNVSEAA